MKDPGCKKIPGTQVRLVTVENLTDLEMHCAHHLEEKLLQHADRPVILLVSGGSALRIVNRVDPIVIGKNVELCIIDERFGVRKEDENYYALSQTDFAQVFVKQGGSVCHANIEGAENLTVAGEMFATHVEKKTAQEDVHVIALLGIGADGHTVGIFPSEDEEEFSQRFDDNDTLAVGYDAGVQHDLPLRATVTLSFLRTHVAHAIVFAAGEEKKEAIMQTLTAKGSLSKTPARIVREMPDVHIFTQYAE